MMMLVSLAVFAASPSLNLEQRFDRMLHATHGVSPSSGKEVATEAADLCKDPKVIALAEARLTPQQLDKQLDEDERRSVDNVVGLLLGYCGPDGVTAVRKQTEQLRLTRDARRVEWLGVVAAAKQNPNLRPSAKALYLRVDRLAGIERTALQAFTVLKDPGLVATSLARLPSEPMPVLQLELAKYLSAAAPKDKQVHAAFQQLRQTARYPALIRALDAYPKP